MEQPNFTHTPGTDKKKNLILWALVIFASLAVIFFSSSYVKKLAEKNKAEKQNQPAIQAELLPSLECDFANNEAAMQKAKEDKSVAVCECIQEENYKFRCQEDAQNEAYFAQARAQFKADFCAMIKNNSGLKSSCEAMVSSGIEYLKKEDPEYLANIYAANGNYDQAIAIISVSEKVKTEVSTMLALALNYAGKALMEHQESIYIPKAEELINKALTIDPNSAEAYRVQGYIYEVKPDIFKSIESYNKSLEKDPNYILALAGRGHAYNLMGDLNKALEDFQKAAELDKDKQQLSIYANLCRLQTSRNDLLEEGIKNCQIVIASSLTGALQKGEANQIIADAYVKKENYAEALIYLENAKAFDPNDPNLLIGFAHLYIAKEDYPKAKESAQKAIDIDPLKTVAYRALAYALLMEKDYTQAEVQALKGLEVINKDPSLLISNKPYFQRQLNYILADIYAALGNKEKESQHKEAGDKAMEIK